jgi:hypothetical protein
VLSSSTCVTLGMSTSIPKLFARNICHAWSGGGGSQT